MDFLPGGDPSKRIPDGTGARVAIRDAVYPNPFPNALEFNAPVHETWNIVHSGMLVPEAHQIYICADNCMRGVVMTAAEMNAIGRFSCVVLEEHDLYEGNLEEITLEGVTNVIRKLRSHAACGGNIPMPGRPYFARREGDPLEEAVPGPESFSELHGEMISEDAGLYPRAVLVFPVCLHHFMGCDLGFVYRELERRFPDIDFIRCWMDPIMQKTGPTPEQKERKAVMDVLKNPPDLPEEGIPGAVFLGDNFPLDPESELMQLMQAAGHTEKNRLRMQIQDCTTYRQYLALAASPVLLTRSAAAERAARQTAGRLGKQFLYLPPAVGYAEIAEELRQVKEILFPGDALRTGEEVASIRRCEAALARAGETITDTPIAIDSIATPRPLGLARLLLEHGFAVREVYLDAVSGEEQKDFVWLQTQAPDLELCCTNHVKARVLHGKGLRKMESAAEGQDAKRYDPFDHSRYLAIGPKAAWFCGTRHFVNLVEYGGMWGFSGICRLADLMIDAFEKEKDTRSIVPRKGLGCACIL